MKELHETKTTRVNVDRESRSLPSQTLQDVVMDVKEVQQSDPSDPGGGGGGTVSREAGGGTGQRAGN